MTQIRGKIWTFQVSFSLHERDAGLPVQDLRAFRAGRRCRIDHEKQGLKFLCFAQYKKDSGYLARFYLPDLRGDRIESHHQEMVLFPCELCRFLPAPWPGEAPGFETLVEEEKAVAFPEEPFDAVAPSAAEKKEDILFRGIQVIIRKYQLGQAFDSFPKIGVACRDHDLADVVRFTQHGGFPP